MLETNLVTYRILIYPNVVLKVIKPSLYSAEEIRF